MGGFKLAQAEGLRLLLCGLCCFSFITLFSGGQPEMYNTYSSIGGILASDLLYEVSYKGRQRLSGTLQKGMSSESLSFV